MSVSRRSALVGAGFSAALARADPDKVRTTVAPAIFVSPHQDDELLWMGAAIMEHVAVGRDVTVLLLGRGNKSGVRDGTRPTDMPAGLGRTPWEKEFGAVRDREFSWSVSRLGAKCIIPSWDARLDEKAFTVAAVKQIIRAHCPAGSDLKTVSKYGEDPTNESQTDHIAVHD